MLLVYGLSLTTLIQLARNVFCNECEVCLVQNYMYAFFSFAWMKCVLLLLLYIIHIISFIINISTVDYFLNQFFEPL